MPILSVRSLTVVVIALGALSACGGGSGDAPQPPSGPAVTVNLPQAYPAEHTGKLVGQSLGDVSTQYRTPDPFSAAPYCLVRYADLRHSDGKTYAMVVAFRASDLRVLAVTLNNRATSWFVAAVDLSASEAAVDLPTRTFRFYQARSTQGGQVDWQAVIDGSALFPAAPDSASCG